MSNTPLINKIKTFFCKARLYIPLSIKITFFCYPISPLSIIYQSDIPLHTNHAFLHKCSIVHLYRLSCSFTYQSHAFLGLPKSCSFAFQAHSFLYQHHVFFYISRPGLYLYTRPGVTSHTEVRNQKMKS